MRRSRSSTRRALEAERAEIERDEARKPFEAQTRRAWELTKQFNKYPSALGPRIVTLLRTDAIVVNAGAALYNRVPRPGTYISIEYHYRPERVLAKFMASMKLPGFWPPRYNDFTVVEDLRYGLLEEDDGADAGIVRPLRDMIPERATELRSSPESRSITPLRMRKAFWSRNSAKLAPRSASSWRSTPKSRQRIARRGIPTGWRSSIGRCFRRIGG